jgi:xanthine dehydrogenase YagT iron-sulfur-binding subunit
MSNLHTFSESAGELTRREFVKLSAAAGAAVALSGCASTMVSKNTAVLPTPELSSPTAIDVTLRVNGQARRLTIEPRVTLLDALRENLALTGTKKGCDHGQCGACTVIADGQRINACLAFAAMYDGSTITTVEGLAQGGQLHPLQAAFIKHDAFQCGYCTSGQLCSGVALLKEGRARNDAEIRELMSGNICRCGAYPGVVAAIREVSGRGAPGVA